MIEVVASTPTPALAEALRRAAAAGVDARLAPPAAAPLPAPTLGDYERVLRERRGARGWDAAEIRRRLEQAPWAAVARLLRGETAGLLLLAGAEQVRPPLALMEPAPGMALAPLRLALAADGQPVYGLLGALPAGAGAAAAAVESANQAIGRALNARLTPTLVYFGVGGDDAAAAPATALEAALRARAFGARTIALYSPFFYAHGVLQAALVLATIREQVAAPLIAAPHLAAALETGLTNAPPAETPPLTATWLAGAERPAAWAEPDAGAQALAATLRLLAGAAA